MPKERGVRQEFLFALRIADRAPSPEALSRVLIHVADLVLRTKRALLRGEVVSIGEPPINDAGCSDLYASLPVAFPDGLETFMESAPPTVYVWLFPLHPHESRFVRDHGWSDFEDRLEAALPPVDLFDMNRKSVV
jgi:hypothetical protein